MAGDMNRATLVGRVGSDPETKSTRNGGEMATFRLATGGKYKTANGEERDNTQWHSIVVYNERLVKLVRQYINKGSKLLVEGEIQTRKWQDQNGGDRYTTEIVLNFNAQILLLGDKGESSGGSSRHYPSGGGGGTKRTMTDADLDDEIPFD